MSRARVISFRSPIAVFATGNSLLLPRQSLGCGGIWPGARQVLITSGKCCCQDEYDDWDHQRKRGVILLPWSRAYGCPHCWVCASRQLWPFLHAWIPMDVIRRSAIPYCHLPIFACEQGCRSTAASTAGSPLLCVTCEDHPGRGLAPAFERYQV